MTALPEHPGCVDCEPLGVCTYHRGWADALAAVEGGHLPGPWARTLWHGPHELAHNLRTWAWDDVERAALAQRLRGMADWLEPERVP